MDGIQEFLRLAETVSFWSQYIWLPIGMFFGWGITVLKAAMLGRRSDERFHRLETGLAKVEGQTEGITSVVKLLEVLSSGKPASSDYLLHFYGPDANISVHYTLPGELICGTPVGDLVIKLEEKTFEEQKTKIEHILRVLHKQEFLAPIKDMESRLKPLYGLTQQVAPRC